MRWNTEEVMDVLKVAIDGARVTTGKPYGDFDSPNVTVTLPDVKNGRMIVYGFHTGQRWQWSGKWPNNQPASTGEVEQIVVTQGMTEDAAVDPEADEAVFELYDAVRQALRNAFGFKRTVTGTDGYF